MLTEGWVASRTGRDVEPHCSVPWRSLSSRALLSLTRWPTAIVCIFSCFFSFSPVNMCFQYPSEPGLWGPLLLSPVLVFSPQPEGLAGAVPSVTGSPVPSCLEANPTGRGKFRFSESWSRHWGSFLLFCEVQILFLIIVDGLSPVVSVDTKGDVATSPAGWSCCDSAAAEDPMWEPCPGFVTHSWGAGLCPG